MYTTPGTTLPYNAYGCIAYTCGALLKFGALLSLVFQLLYVVLCLDSEIPPATSWLARAESRCIVHAHVHVHVHAE